MGRSSSGLQGQMLDRPVVDQLKNEMEVGQTLIRFSGEDSMHCGPIPELELEDP